MQHFISQTKINLNPFLTSLQTNQLSHDDPSACTASLVIIFECADWSNPPEIPAEEAALPLVLQTNASALPEIFPHQLACSLLTRHFIVHPSCVCDSCASVSVLTWTSSAPPPPCLPLAEKQLPAVKAEMCHVDKGQTRAIRTIWPQPGR